jgi:hypothetical protein
MEHHHQPVSFKGFSQRVVGSVVQPLVCPPVLARARLEAAQGTVSVPQSILVVMVEPVSRLVRLREEEAVVRLDDSVRVALASHRLRHGVQAELVMLATAEQAAARWA